MRVEAANAIRAIPMFNSGITGVSVGWIVGESVGSGEGVGVVVGLAVAAGLIVREFVGLGVGMGNARLTVQL